ncbi:uncharacterized protein LOC144715451 [Wolffia australiana]
MGDLRGVLAGEDELALKPRSLNPSPSAIGADHWRLGEKTVERIIRRIQPSGITDRRRRLVVDFVRDLIQGITGADVFPFGSVPLKTYLPDGDIDLTAIEPRRSEECLANDVLSILRAEEQNKSSQFEVKDVQYIHAEVKLVKCLVQNIVVDISFQQVGGLCTLCFLEKVDRIIGKNHLFKRSIILIKAWCYYESRILGAHHGLISTYALETLILYIFHLFYPSLDGPLEVLYFFLDYFSRFDWDSYGVSLNGPISLDSLPETITETPEENGVQSLLSRDFLRKCENEFASTFKWSDNAAHPQLFHRKHLNIVDPLKEKNNLGRSVNKGNFYRIRSAFTFGARKLGRILTLPEEKIEGELCKFFLNTLDRHGNTGPMNEPETLLLDCDIIKSPRQSQEGNGSPATATLDFRGGLFKDIAKLRISELQEPTLPNLENFTEHLPESAAVETPSSSSSSSSSSPKTHHLRENSGHSDLAGDYNSHMRSLLCAVGCFERHPTWSYPFYGGLYSTRAVSPFGYYAFIPSSYAQTQGSARHRGTGTYFPNVSHWVHQEKRSSGRTRSQHAPTTRSLAMGDNFSGGKVNGHTGRRHPQRQRAPSCSDMLKVPPPDIGLEFGSLGAFKTPLPPSPLPEKVNGIERSGDAYHLNEDDFPPLVQWSR